MELRTSVVIAMAHRLAGHPGLCRNLHGHNWVVNYSVGVNMEEADPSTGYVLELGQLRKNVKSIVDMFDHSVVLQERDVLIPSLREANQRLHIIDVPPSTEHLARLFFSIIEQGLKAFYPDHSVHLEYVDLVETPNNTVSTWSGGGVKLI
jgi:6-pyruvoyltetrahydropterin/6-carboxytetrahydropterin synthase